MLSPKQFNMTVEKCVGERPVLACGSHLFLILLKKTDNTTNNINVGGDNIHVLSVCSFVNINFVLWLRLWCVPILFALLCLWTNKLSAH